MDRGRAPEVRLNRSTTFLGEAPGEGAGAEAADDKRERVVPEAVAVEVPCEFVSVVAGVGLRERGEGDQKHGEETADGFHREFRCEQILSRRCARAGGVIKDDQNR